MTFLRPHCKHALMCHYRIILAIKGGVNLEEHLITKRISEDRFYDVLKKYTFFVELQTEDRTEKTKIGFMKSTAMFIPNTK